ncbi:alpha-ketoglutarate-dependent dioxygenase AlkB family protein [Parapedobacter sp.]
MNRQTDLFSQTNDRHRNWLPYDGTVHYYGRLLSKAQADHYLARLLETIEWRNDEAVIFGKKIITKRKVAWYGNAPYEYTYSNTTKRALHWTADLLELKALLEKATGERFNSCLLNLYHSGEEGMAWHSDGETDLQKDGTIGSLSFGAERKFAFKHKQSKEKVALVLEHGSLLVMKDATQTHWLHRLPPTKKISVPRVNLTFRSMVES